MPLPPVPDSVKPDVLFRETMVMSEKVYAVPFWNSSNLIILLSQRRYMGKKNDGLC